MDAAKDLDNVILHDESDQPVKRPRNWLYEQVAALQANQRRTGVSRYKLPPLIEIAGEPLSETILRERRGDFD